MRCRRAWWPLWVVVAACGACATPPPPRPLDEDLRALLPSGADLVFDFDMVQLRAWALGRDVRDLVYRRLPLPPELAPAAWNVDQIVGAVTGIDDWATAEVFVVMKGELHLPDAVKRESLGERPIVRLGDRAIVWLGRRLAAYGTMGAIERLVERVDRRHLTTPTGVLAEVLQSAPTGKYTRPAVIVGAHVSPTLRERLGGALPVLGPTDEIAVAFAVADGFDLGVVMHMASELEARVARDELSRALGALTTRPLARALGAETLLPPLKTGARDRELHIAYRLPAERAAELFGRLRALVAMVEGARPKTEEHR